MAGKKGIVNIHGRQYKTVALRISEFREQCAAADGWGVETFIIDIKDDWVCMGCKIFDPEGRIVGSGHGLEFWEGSKINKTSALENAETSALGRALASIGLGGDEYASADEVLSAIRTQEVMESTAEAAPSPVEQDDIPEDIKEVVLENCKIMSRWMEGTDEDYRVWHNRVLKNFYSVDSIEDLTKAQLADFADKQKHKMKSVGKE